MAEVNKKSEGDYGYATIYKGVGAEVWAKTTYDAQRIAAAHFKARKPWEVSVLLAERPDGSQVVHVPDF